MPRKKSYERGELEARALGVFAARGFQGASTELLVRALGVNRNSVYAEFGSKEGLFAAALIHYEREVVDRLFCPLEAPGADLDQVEAFFRTLRHSAEGSLGLGCLMCNTAAELGGARTDLQPIVQRHFARMHEAFLNALHGARQRRQVGSMLDAGVEARFLAASSIGICLMVRGGLSAAAAAEAVDGALAHLASLRRGGLCN